jgi:rare lipoprotein A
MRLLVDAGNRLLLLGLSAALSACGAIGGGGTVETTQGAPLAVSGPAADYPMVLGDPFTVDGELFTPADTLNYDAVGYAGIDAGAGVTAAHRTLPLPSYAEVTSLESGKTILVRVERRGPMAGRNLVSLSPAAAAQLGAGEGTPVRLRRVNPPEAERAKLRSGQSAPERMETPKSLVEVLRRKLPAVGAATLSAPATTQAVRPLAPAVPAVPVVASGASAVGSPRPVTAYPLPGLAATAAAPKAVVVARAEPAPRVAAVRPAPVVRPAPLVSPASGDFVIQAAAFASRANADRAAKVLGGSVSPAGRLFRVRTGPFATRAQAQAALAKVRAAGYSDARVTTAD